MLFSTAAPQLSLNFEKCLSGSITGLRSLISGFKLRVSTRFGIDSLRTGVRMRPAGAPSAGGLRSSRGVSSQSAIGRLPADVAADAARGVLRGARSRIPLRGVGPGGIPVAAPDRGPSSPQPASAPWHGDDAVAALSRSVASGTGGDQPVGVPPGHAGAWWPAAEPAPRRDHRRLEGLTGSAHRHQRAAAYPPAARRRQRRFPRRCRALRRERTQCGHDTPAWRLRTVDKRWQPDDLVHPHRHLRAEHGGGHVRQHLHNARPVPASRTRRILSSCIN